MKNQSNIGARRPSPCTGATFADRKSLLVWFVIRAKRSLFQSISKAFKDKFSHCRLAPSNLELQRRVKASQTQSNQIQPPHPLPVKKSVKYLALFDHSSFLSHATKSDHIRPNPTNLLCAATHESPTCNQKLSTFNTSTNGLLFTHGLSF
jgi:hypothetical protein